MIFIRSLERIMKAALERSSLVEVWAFGCILATGTILAQTPSESILLSARQSLKSEASADRGFYGTNFSIVTSKQALSDVFHGLTWPNSGYIESNKVISPEVTQLQKTAIQDLRSILPESLVPPNLEAILLPVRGAFRGLSEAEQKQMHQPAPPSDLLTEHAAGTVNRDSFIARYQTAGHFIQLYVSDTDIVITVCPEQSRTTLEAPTIENALAQAHNVLSLDLNGTDWKQFNPWPSGSICIWGFAPRAARQVRIWFDGTVVQIKCARSAIPAVTSSPRWQGWFATPRDK